jgi:putative copper export protein/mono/diheme cytochrome c family protein
VIRATLYLGVVAALGALVVPRWIAPHPAVPQRGYFRAGFLAGVALLCIGTLAEAAQILARAAGAVDASLFVAYAFETRQGSIFALRIVVAALLVPIGLTAKRGGFDAAIVALGIALLATFSLTAHAAATARAVPVAADLAHLTAMTVWVGTLLYVAWLPLWSAASPDASRAARYRRAMMRRVSTTGAAGVAVVVGTGLYMAATSLWGPSALTSTPYGQTLLWKIAAVAGVVGVAGVNRWVIAPAVERRGAAPAVGRWLKLETIGMLGVLALSGALVSRPLPEAPATVTGPVRFSETAGRWLVHGTLRPGGAGLALEVFVTDPRGGAAPDGVDVRIALLMQDHAMEPVTVRPTRVAPGAFRAAIALSMGGRWELRIGVDGHDVRVPLRAASTVAVGHEWRALLPGGALALAGIVVAVIALDRGHTTPAWRGGLASVGGLATIAGFVLLWRLLTAAGPAALPVRQNPVAPTPESRGIGRRLYDVHCQMCHGPDGRGDGPLASTLRPRPADLRVHMAMGHTDGQLFEFISDGFPGTAMPAFGQRLSEMERWHVINYIRRFGTSPPAGP